MLEWLWRALRIKRYFVRYRFPSQKVNGCIVEGAIGPMFKYEADYVAAASNARFGNHHYVEEVRRWAA